MDVKFNFQLMEIGKVTWNTAEGDFSQAAYQLIVRNPIPTSSSENGKRSDLVMKYNHVDLAMVQMAPVDPRTSADYEVKDKLEMDIYPCSNKFARSIKLKQATPFNQTFSNVEQVKKLFKHLSAVVPEGSEEMKLATPPFARQIIELPVKIGFSSPSGNEMKNVMVDSKFVLSATYGSIEDALRGKKQPSVVELSFRAESLQSSSLKKSGKHHHDKKKHQKQDQVMATADAELLLKAVWQIFRGMSTFDQVIENEC